MTIKKLTGPNIGENVGLLPKDSDIVKMHIHIVKQSDTLKKVNTHLPYDPAILRLFIQEKGNLGPHKNICYYS